MEALGTTINLSKYQTFFFNNSLVIQAHILRILSDHIICNDVNMDYDVWEVILSVRLDIFEK
jgi:hypothetical protein